MTGKNIISIYSPDKPYTVYDQKEWWGNDREPLTYGQKIDATKSFFAQFDELAHKVPHISLVNISSENSEYCALG